MAKIIHGSEERKKVEEMAPQTQRPEKEEEVLWALEQRFPCSPSRRPWWSRSPHCRPMENPTPEQGKRCKKE